MKQVEGNLIRMAKEGHFDVVIHGCNCFCTMGAGIAKQIRASFPGAYQADLETVRGDRSKLGNFSLADVHCGDNSFKVINAYTQFDWRGTGTKADYRAIESVFKQIKTLFAGSRIGYPMIGAGLAGGNWDLISQIIDNELMGEDHTLVVFKP